MSSIAPISNVTPKSGLNPLIKTIIESNDSLPANTLPMDTNGTVVENAKKSVNDVIYNNYGKILKDYQRNLIGYA
jgi:hypothetical protein